jgi:hypothetical protein
VIARRVRSFLLLALMLALVPWQAATPLARAQAAACSTSSGPVGGAYAVVVCFSGPTPGQVVSGDATVAISTSVTGVSPGIRRVVYTMDGANLLAAFAPPYSFVVPTTKWVDGVHRIQVELLMRDGFVSSRATVDVIFANGVTAPPINRLQRTPVPGTKPAAGAPMVLAAVGDGPDGAANARAVSDLVVSWNPNMFIYLGDVYDDGTKAEYHNWYGRASQPASLYGRLRNVTNPTIGNHEYTSGVAEGYFDYWDNVPDYYSYSANGWHFVSLNSTSQMPSELQAA